MTIRSSARAAVARAAVAVTFTLLLAACSDSTTEPVTPARFSTAYVFGASLDDTGNSCNLSTLACPPAGYATGRYSNGPLWVELVAQRYGASVAPARTGGTNYAYAGARTGPIAGTSQLVPNMVQQVDQFLAAPASATGNRATALFIVDAATVGNDITDALVQGITNPSAAVTIVNGSVANTVSIVNRLYTAGARNILVANSTDIGRTPQVRALGATAIAGASALSAQFNAGLAAQLPAIRTASPGLNLVLLDLGALTNEVFAAPATFGFTTLTAPCFVSPAVATCTTPDAFFFWDAFHPTAATGRLVSQRAISALGN